MQESFELSESLREREFPFYERTELEDSPNLQKPEKSEIVLIESWEKIPHEVNERKYDRDEVNPKRKCLEIAFHCFSEIPYSITVCLGNELQATLTTENIH